MLIRGYGDAAVSQEMVYKWSDIFMLVLNWLMTNNTQVIHQLQQQMKTCQKSIKLFEQTED
jgi:hypothetical protein